jgi:hypothetical protein
MKELEKNEDLKAKPAKNGRKRRMLKMKKRLTLFRFNTKSDWSPE